MVAVTLWLTGACGDVVLFETRDSGHADASLDANLDGTAPCGQAPPPQCGTNREPRICFENVAGCVGDVIEVPVFVEAPTGCGESFDQGGGIELGPFSLENPQNIDPSMARCLRREVIAGSIEWGRLSSDSIPDGCPATFGVGFVDTLRLRIPSDLPPGDYVQQGIWGLIESEEPACASMLPAQGPIIRVSR
ncbi:MAG: hypothetical protein AAGF12_06640 [Myxococcota bacterium]